MVKELTLAACCGIYCGDCELLVKRCSGCVQVEGKPFWTELFKMDVCPIYDCCVNQHKLEHCGLCAEFACETFTSLRDPSLSDEEFEQSLHNRQKDLLSRKEIGTESWLRERS